jgi:choline dehydrogenase-like flavoprotein
MPDLATSWDNSDGTNPAKSVVNADLRSHDHSNLFIVGAACRLE